MSTRTGKRAGGSASARAKKRRQTPKFLLVKDADRDEEQARLLKMQDAGDPAAQPANETPADETPADGRPEEDWPEREGIRDGLVDQVSARFGIPQDVAIRAVNDMLRLS